MTEKILLIGSANRGKARELAQILEGLPWQVKSLVDFPAVSAPEETGTSFEENAILKARYYSTQLQLPCVADDSGLVVDALDGAPGVFSARYAGPNANDDANNAKLLQNLEDLVWHERSARFVCCAVFMAPGGEPHAETGTVEGHIAQACFGDGGFGYDPLFVPEGHDQTFGEMDQERKHKISHRGRALRKLRTYLEQWG